MLKKLSFASGLRSSAGPSSGSSFAKEKGKIVKYTPYSSKHHRESDDDDDLDEVAVISNATPENVTYGSGGTSTHVPGGSSANGPRIVPGIITSTRFESKPYVPATCTMQPKISSSFVIQSTATSRAKKTNTTSSAAYIGSHQDGSYRVTGKGVASASSAQPSSSSFSFPTSKAASSDKDLRQALRSSDLNARASELVDRCIPQPEPIETISSKVTCAPGSSSLRSVHETAGASTGKAGSTTILAASTCISRSGAGGVIMSSSSAAETTELSKKTREARRKQIKREFEKSAWTGSGSGEKSGCNWSFVFDPSGRLVYYWSMIVSLAFIYNSWVIVYRFAFAEIASDTVFMWLTLDGIADFIYILDVVVHFRIGYLEEGVLQTQAPKLRQHYMNSTIFYIDCLCLLPLDFLYLSIGFNSMLRCFRLIKIYRFWSFLDRTERHTNYPNVFRTVSLFHYILVLFHWNACVYHMLSQRDGFGSKDWFRGSRDLDSCTDVDCDYLHAFYWSTLALTTIGDLPRPRTKAEYIFLVTELVMGLFLLASVLGHVANIVTNVSAARKEFQAKLDAVKTYMRMRRVPEHLKIKVIKWFDYLWMTQKSSDEEKSVGFLPAKLKAEIAIHVHLDTLKRVEIFQNTEAGFLCALVLRLKPVLFSPSDYVCRKGEIGKEMFIVNRGKLQVVADNGRTVLATLRAGSYFGEISILNMGTAGNRRTASVRSVGYSDLFCLSKNDMWDVLKDYPAARVRLEAIAVKRLEKYRKEPLKKISMGRSRSTPGLVETKSQLNLVDNNTICPFPDAGDHEAAKTSPHSPHNNGTASSAGSAGDLISSSRRGDSDVRTSDPEMLLHQHQSASSVINRSLHDRGGDPVVVVSDSAQVLYPPPPTYTSITSMHQPQLTQSSNIHLSLWSASQTEPTGGPSIEMATATTAQHISDTGPPFFLTAASPQTPIRRSSSPHIASSAVPVLTPGASLANMSPPHTFPLLPEPEPSQMRSRTPVPGELSQEGLILEIRRLRERLFTLEHENTSMSMKLSQQHWKVESRLAEIEQQITSSAVAPASGPLASAPVPTAVCDPKRAAPLSSPSSSTSHSSHSSGSSSYDDSERNKESII